MKNDEVKPLESVHEPAPERLKEYKKPQITEWGSVIDLTQNFLNGAIDPNFGVGGTVPG